MRLARSAGQYVPAASRPQGLPSWGLDAQRPWHWLPSGVGQPRIRLPWHRSIRLAAVAARVSSPMSFWCLGNSGRIVLLGELWCLGNCSALLAVLSWAEFHWSRQDATRLAAGPSWRPYGCSPSACQGTSAPSKLRIVMRWHFEWREPIRSAALGLAAAKRLPKGGFQCGAESLGKAAKHFRFGGCGVGPARGSHTKPRESFVCRGMTRQARRAWQRPY